VTSQYILELCSTGILQSVTSCSSPDVSRSCGRLICEKWRFSSPFDRSPLRMRRPGGLGSLGNERHVSGHSVIEEQIPGQRGFGIPKIHKSILLRDKGSSFSCEKW